MKRRVVITGIGLVTPIGVNTDITWHNILKSVSGVKKIPDSLFKSEDIASKVAAYISTTQEDPILGLDLSTVIGHDLTRRSDRFIQLGLAAAVEAIEDSKWRPNGEFQQTRTGVLLGSGIGGLICIEENANKLFNGTPRNVSPFFIPASLINLVSGHISIKYGFKGPNYSIVTACASSAHSIGEAARIISCDDADVVIAGGSEAAICRLGVAGFSAMRALSTKYNDNPQKASRPWDKDRDGFVIGEGAGVLVLEEYEHALKRNAKIYGELIGYGLTSDAYHITTPDESGDGGYRAMKLALLKANINPEDINYINAHGTSTKLGDIAEYRAVAKLFGNGKDGRDKNRELCMSSTKSSIGHLLGAAGSVEAIFCLLAMRDNIIPPTLNLDNKEEECEINLVPHQAIKHNVSFTLSNSFGFGGTNVSLIFKKL